VGVEQDQRGQQHDTVRCFSQFELVAADEYSTYYPRNEKRRCGPSSSAPEGDDAGYTAFEYRLNCDISYLPESWSSNHDWQDQELLQAKAQT
jgi:hypothetical protein